MSGKKNGCYERRQTNKRDDEITGEDGRRGEKTEYQDRGRYTNR